MENNIYMSIKELDKLTQLMKTWSYPRNIAIRLLEDLNASNEETIDKLWYWATNKETGPKLYNMPRKSDAWIIKLLYADYWISRHKPHYITADYKHYSYLSPGDIYDDTVIYDRKEQNFFVGTIADLPNFELEELGKDDTPF